MPVNQKSARESARTDAPAPVPERPKASTHLLDIRLLEDNGVEVDTVFETVKAADVQHAIKSYMPALLNATFAKGKTTGDSVRIFLVHTLAAILSAYSDESIERTLREMMQLVAEYRDTIRRTQ